MFLTTRSLFLKIVPVDGHARYLAGLRIVFCGETAASGVHPPRVLRLKFAISGAFRKQNTWEAETMKSSRLTFILRLLILSICLWISPLPTWAESLEELNKALLGNDVEAAWKAVEGMPRKISPEQREEAIKTLTGGLKKEWIRCAGDIRQSIASQLAALNAKEAIPDLLVLIREKKNIDHECAE
jgi:hypothetical protein